MGHHNQGGDLLKGALLGGLLGGAAALLLAPKSGKELRDDIEDGYNSISEKTQDLVENLRETGRKLTHPFEEEKSFFNGSTPFVVGGAVGAVIGITAALLLAPKSGGELREVLGDKYEEICDKAEDFVSNLDSKRKMAMNQMTDWKDTLTTIIDKISSKKAKKNFHLDEILDWAGLGLKLMHQLQKRR